MENIFGFVAGAEWIWLISIIIVIVIIIAVISHFVKGKKKSVQIGLEDVDSENSENTTSNEKPLKILRERLAKGEITKEEYDDLRKELD